MNNELQDIIITIDTREQNEKRINAVETWGKTHGAYIEHRALKHLDYQILGDFKGHEINIGIEAKALSQFCSDEYELNKEKLFAACSVYDTVALFIETGNYEFKAREFGNTNISITVKKDLTITGSLAIFEGAMSTLARYGIHVRQLRSEAHFPYAIENLLTYSIHEHDLIKAPDFLTQYKSTLLTFCTPLQMRKIVQAYPNMFWLCSAGEDAYKAIIGRKAGEKLYNFIRNPLLVTKEWSNSHFPNGEEKERVYETKDVIEAIITYLKGFPEGRSAEEICDHFDLHDEDKEKLLECLKKMAYKGLITNNVAGLFIYVDIFNVVQGNETEPGFKSPAASLQSSSADNSGNKHPITENANTDKITSDRIFGTHDKSQSQCDPTGNFSKSISTTSLQSNHTPAIDNNKIQNSDDKTDSAVSYSASSQGSKTSSPVLSESQNVQEQDLSIIPPSTSNITPAPVTPDKFQEPDIELFGKTNPDWTEPDIKKMSLKDQLKAWFSDGLPHTMQETVDAHDVFANGRVFDMVMGGVKAKYLERKIIPASEGQPSRVVFQRIKK